MSEKSDGSDFVERLDLYGNAIFVKNYMDPFSNNRFQEYLHSNKIGHLLISGIDATFCINKAVKSAIEKGYNVSIVSDGIAAGSNEVRTEKIADFQDIGVKTIKAVDVISKSEPKMSANINRKTP